MHIAAISSLAVEKLVEILRLDRAGIWKDNTTTADRNAIEPRSPLPC